MKRTPVLLLLAGAVSVVVAWAAWPEARAGASSDDNLTTETRRRSTSSGADISPEGERTAEAARAEARQAGRDRIADARYEMLDALAEEQDLTEEQYDRLAEVLESEQAAAEDVLDALRPGPGRPPTDPNVVASEMAARKAEADAAAREALTPEQFAAWEARRAPKAMPWPTRSKQGRGARAE